MCVLKPLKVVITNYPQDQVENLELPRHPKQDMGVRVLPFSREIYIDAGDFEEVPPAGFKRLVPGGEVRLRGSYVIRADEAVKDDQGNIVELRCSYDENTLGTNPEGRKVKGVIHWVPAAESVECEVRLYDRLFRSANPEKDEEGGSFWTISIPSRSSCSRGAALSRRWPMRLLKSASSSSVKGISVPT